MQNGLRSIFGVLAALIAVGTLAGLLAAARRLGVENRNRRVEIGVEYAEVDNLAQVSGRSITSILTDFKAQNVSALIMSEETLGNLEAIGAMRIQRLPLPGGRTHTLVTVYSPETLDRIRQALTVYQVLPILPPSDNEPLNSDRFADSTTFTLSALAQNHAPSVIAVHSDYAHLRSLGIGLPPDGIAAANTVGLQIVGRIANFLGAVPATERTVLTNLKAQGASIIIFVGDDILGYRGQEKPVADLLRSPDEPGSSPNAPPPIGLLYGEVEFGKQKGDPVLMSALHGDYVRVHSIQTAEMGQMDENAMVDRYALAGRERNIRFCYVRLLTFAGPDAVAQDAGFLKKISQRIAHGSLLTAGGLEFGPAHPFGKPGVPTWLYGLLGLGTAAGIVWMLIELCPLPSRMVTLLLGALGVICVGLAVSSQTGRTLVALFAGIAFPTIACLRAYPRPHDEIAPDPSLPPYECLRRAMVAIGAASAITTLGILHVIGLLAAREFIVKSSQFLGIKAQHGVPILLIALTALAGGVTLPGETLSRYRERVVSRIGRALDEPARYGLLLLGIVALAALGLILLRTGNDSGVAVSGAEMKGRALLDRLLPVRPRTKEFLVGHPAFVLALAWWWRGRRKLAIPCFVVGSIGQVSLLNTFCHIHTPLIASVWRGGLGLAIGTLLGGLLFLLLEKAIKQGVGSRQ